VPPIFAPAVAARAIHWAAYHGGREHWVGASTAAAVLGTRIAPGLLDRYLARTGYGSQQTGTPRPADAPDNLRAPLPGDAGAEGPFRSRARPVSLAWWAPPHPGVLGLAALALGAGAGLWPRRRLITGA
jgi:hypothetical protein